MPSNLVDLLDMVVPPGPPSTTDPWGLPSDGNPPQPLPRSQNNGSMDLLGLNLNSSTSYSGSMGIQPNDPWAPTTNTLERSPVTSPNTNDPWTGRPASSLGVPTSTAPPLNNLVQNDPWNPVPAPNDPWALPTNNSSFGSSPSLATNGDIRAFDPLGPSSSKSANNLDALGGGAFNMSGMAQNLPPTNNANMMPNKKTPENFLGENSNLVNLDALISSKPTSQIPGSTNPFAVTQNAFQTAAPPRVSLNQMRNQQQFVGMNMNYGSDPFAPQQTTTMMSNPTIVPTSNQMATTLAAGGPGLQNSATNNPFL